MYSSPFAGKALRLPLENDEQLLTGLTLHLRPLVNRMQFGILAAENPLLDKIKDRYAVLFQVALMASMLIEQKYGVALNEDEIGYIAMHIGASLQRFQKARKALLVCVNNTATTRLLYAQLEYYFPDLKIMGVSTLAKLKETADASGADLVISTVPLEFDGVPVVKVSPMLTQDDINRIGSLLRIPVANSFTINSVPDRPIPEQLGRLLYPSLVLRFNPADKAEALRYIVNALEAEGYVTEGFCPQF